VRRARRGDERAFAELVRMHQEIAYRIAYLISGDEGEDAVQDGVLKAWRALGRFRPGAPFRPWLLRIVANEARNRRRSSGRRAALALRAEREDVSGGAAPSPEAAGSRLPLPARALRDRDRRCARRAPRHGQVSRLARARATAGEL